MRSRAVRRPATDTTPLKKKPPPKPSVGASDEAGPVDHVGSEDAPPPPTVDHVEQDPPPSHEVALEQCETKNYEQQMGSTGHRDEEERPRRLDLNLPHCEMEEDGGGLDELRGSDRISEAVEEEEVEEEEEVGVGDEEEFIEEEVDAEGSVGVVDDGEHHDFVRERYKRKEYEIFIGGLDRGTTEEELRKIFSEVGEIVEVRLMKNHITGVSKGFAFLRFATVDQAKRACAELKHPRIHGKQCGVAPSKDSDTLFIGHICKTWSKETLKEKLAEYGVDNFEELTLVEDTAIVGMNRGFAFLDFSSRSEAVIACKHLQRRNVVFGTDRNAKVAFADTFIEPDDEIMAQVKTVFVDGLPASWDEDRVKHNFKKFGRIEKIELARNMPAAKRADFGFITFDTHDFAVTCAENMNNTDIDDGEKKVKIRARLSRPRQRGRLGKYSRGNYLTRDVSGRGSRFSQDHGMSQWGSRRFAERGQSGDRDCRTFSGGYKRPLGARDRYPVIDLDRDRKRRHLSPWERDVRRAPDSTYERGRLRRDLAQYEEPHSRISDLSSRFAAERRSSLRYRPGYLESPPHNATRDALRRLPVYEEESNGRRIDRHSYHDSHSRDYGSLPGSRRLVPAMDDFDSRYAEPTVIRSRARFDYGGSSGTIQYEDVAYRDEPARIRRGSHLGYDGDVRNSTGHSLGLYEPASSIGYSRGGASRGDGEGIFSSYGRDYLSRDYPSTVAHVGAGSYSSLYSGRDMNDSRLSGHGQGSYFKEDNLVYTVSPYVVKDKYCV